MSDKGETIGRVPSEWLGPFDIYKYSKKAVKLNLQPLVVTWLLVVLIYFALVVALGNVGRILIYFIEPLFYGMLVLLYLNGVHGRQISLDQAINKGVDVWLKMIGAYFVQVVCFVVSFLLFIVPFFFVVPRIVLAPYFMINDDLSIPDAYRASWEATRGHAIKIWLVLLSSIVILLPAVTIIAIPVCIYFIFMYGAATAVMYEYVKQHPQVDTIANK